MSFIGMLCKKFRWLRCSTLCAILSYIFFIGLILHSTSQKLQLHHKPQEQNTLQKNQVLDGAKQLSNNHQEQQPSKNSDHFEQQTEGQKLKQSQLKVIINALGNDNQPEMQQQRQISSLASANDLGNADGKGVTKFGGIITNKLSQSQPKTRNVHENQFLTKAFKRADRNHDNRLSIQELAQFINQRIVDHIDTAIMNNAREFRRVDIAPADGLITWDEYHRFFLREHGMTEADIDEHDEIRHTALNRKAREEMMRDKARWSEAARTDLFTLTIDEYLSFRHPESSVSNLLELVDDLLRQFDEDGDDQLTLEEFSDLNVNDDDDIMRKSLISKTLVERQAEFKRIIDKNRDGKADRGELLNYVNPKTPRYALQEAATLISLCDKNKDEVITFDEMTENAEIFLQSKMIDTANSFHNEF